MKTCVIFNPTARGDKARRFQAFLEKMAKDCSFKPTTGPGVARDLAREAVEEGFETIVAAGGDGTVNEVLNGLGDAKDGFARARLGILPLGTVNVFAKELRIPEKLEAAWATIVQGKERKIDLPIAEITRDGKNERRYFAQLAGAGLDAQAIELVDWETKRRFGQLAYVYAGVKALFRPHPMIEARSGADTVQGELVLIGNGKYYGGRVPMFPDARLDDGKLDVCVFPRVGLGAVMKFLFWLCLGRFRHAHPARHFSTDQLELVSTETAMFELEGDVAGRLPVRVSLAPGKLRVVCESEKLMS